MSSFEDKWYDDHSTLIMGVPIDGILTDRLKQRQIKLENETNVREEKNKGDSLNSEIDKDKDKDIIGGRKKKRNKDGEVWESSKLRQLGFIEDGNVYPELAENSDNNRDGIIVRRMNPAFLTGKLNMMKEEQPMHPVKDLTCDLAVLARRGSAIVRRVKMDADRNAMKDRFWDIAGTPIGNLLHISKSMSIHKKSNEGMSLIAHNNNKSNYGNFKTDYVSEFSKQSIDTQRRSLPVFQCREQFLHMYTNHQILVVIGETGSGKTTQLAQYIYEEFMENRNEINKKNVAQCTNNIRDEWNNNNNNLNEQKTNKDHFHFSNRYNIPIIGCTQPRRVAAVSVANRVAYEMGCELSTTVGYSIRFEDKTSPETRIKYMTDGVLLRESVIDPELSSYKCIIMDEAHERGINTDVLLGIIKKACMVRMDLKVIITSATLDSQKFSSFFCDCPCFFIKGRNFPVQTFYAKTNPGDYVQASVDQALNIHVTSEKGDILIFMTGQDDIEACTVLLAEKAEMVGNTMDGHVMEMPPMTILPIYSQLDPKLQAKVFQKSPFRKIIIATNIAETSLTLDGVYYVIDSGFCKQKFYDPRIGLNSLLLTPISQANANQRKGRAGRTEKGVCWRLYTENSFYSDMLSAAIPEIQRSSLTNVVLLLKSLKVEDVMTFPFIDPPSESSLLSAMYHLWVLGAIDNNGDLSPLGANMSSFPLDPCLSKMILVASGPKFMCTSEILTIVSMLSVPSVYCRPRGREDESDQKREKFYVPESDHLTLLNVFNQWKYNEYSGNWCEENFLEIKALKKVLEVREQLSDILKSLKIEESCNRDNDIIRMCVSSGYLNNLSKQRGLGVYVNMLTSISCHLHPTSALYGLGLGPGLEGEYVVYHEVLRTSLGHANHTSNQKGSNTNNNNTNNTNNTNNNNTNNTNEKPNKTTRQYMQCVTLFSVENKGVTLEDLHASHVFALSDGFNGVAEIRRTDKKCQAEIDLEYKIKLRKIQSKNTSNNLNNLMTDDEPFIGPLPNFLVPETKKVNQFLKPPVSAMISKTLKTISILGSNNPIYSNTKESNISSLPLDSMHNEHVVINDSRRRRRKWILS